MDRIIRALRTLVRRSRCRRTAPPPHPNPQTLQHGRVLQRLILDRPVPSRPTRMASAQSHNATASPSPSTVWQCIRTPLPTGAVLEDRPLLRSAAEALSQYLMSGSS